jgi:hypothetical protein
LTSDHGLLTRRRAIATIGAAAGALLSPRSAKTAVAGPWPEAARGSVFESRSGDIRKRPGDHGIAGVLVSNGRDVVATDDDGRWSLPVQSGDSLFVITPPQWASAANGAVASSYLHQPLGTPQILGLRSAVIAPTGTLPASIDFPLVRQSQSRSFEALLFADTQAADAKELGFVREVLMSATAGSGAAFAINHGDVMADDLALFPDYVRILEDTGIAWHHCPGNHDMNLDATDPRYAFEAWKRFIGPTNYAFQYSGATFILLNNVEYFGCGAGAAGSLAYRGRIGDDQLRFVANVLRNIPTEHLIVVSMHIPLVSFDDPDSAADTTVDRGALLRLLSDRPHTVSFSGHSHTTEHHYLGAREGFGRDEPHHHHVLTAACGSWWSGPLDGRGIPVADSRDGTPKGFHVLSVDGNRYTTRFVAFGTIADPDVRVIVHDTGGTARPDASVTGPALFVDVFDGGPLTRVTCEIDGRPDSIVELERAGIADPYVVDAFDRYRPMCKSWVAAAPSSHMWTMPLSQGFQAQRNALVVRVTGNYGRTFARRVAAV